MTVDLVAGPDNTFLFVDRQIFEATGHHGSYDAHSATLEKWAQEGRAFVCYFQGWDSLRFRLFVDEPLPPAWHDHTSGHLAGSFLHIESGDLLAIGGSVLLDDDSEHTPALGTVCVPPGSYGLEAIELAWETEPEERLAEALGPVNSRFASTVYAISCAKYLSLALLLAALPLWFSGLTSTALLASALALLAALVFAIAERISKATARWRAIQLTRESVFNEFPDVAIALRSGTPPRAPMPAHLFSGEHTTEEAAAT